MGFADGIVNTMSFESLVKVLVQNSRDAIAEADAVLKLSQTPTVLLSVADTYARAGDDAKAEKLTSAGDRAKDLMTNLLIPCLRR